MDTLDLHERIAIEPALRMALHAHLDAANHDVQKLDMIALVEDLTATAAKARRAIRNRGEIWR